MMTLNVYHQTSVSCFVAAINLVLNEEKEKERLPGNHSLRHDCSQQNSQYHIHLILYFVRYMNQL